MMMDPHDDDEDNSVWSASNGDDVSKSTSEGRRRNEVKQVQELARKETKDVRAWRRVVMIVILITGALVSAGTYSFLRSEQGDDYQDSYYLFANTIGDGAQFHIQGIQNGFDGFSETLTAYANATNATFPFVTLPTFEVHGGHVRHMAGVQSLLLEPLVIENDKEKWERYSVENANEWIARSRAAVSNRGERGDNDVVYYDESTVTPRIYSLDENGQPWLPGPPPYYPAWQMSPPPFSASFHNFNVRSEPFFPPLNGAVEAIRGTVLSNVFDLRNQVRLTMDYETHEAYHRQFVEWDENVTSAIDHPHSVLLHPVFERMNDDTAEVVAVLQAVVPWDRHVTDLLPEGVNGVYCVLKNTCGQAYTYMINGPRATYVGEGDQHDPQFDHMEVVIPFDVRTNNNNDEPSLGGSDSNSSTTTADSIGGHCEYYFNVYPSAAFETEYNSDIPGVFTAVVATTFLLMALTFFIYDRFVQRRNTKVIDAAARSNAIVSSLFPQQVRDRLFAEAENEELHAATSSTQKIAQAPKSRLKNFLNTDEDDDDATTVDEELDTYKSKPIADLFPETTILFADIAGFTAWSSVREPSQVFVLLETVYRAFDEIAKRRRVFKVETVGDCYVAVTGLPDPRRDHALAMSRFAREILIKMNVLTKKLEVSLGPDTGDLCMRIGLHSGPVTAGVLRGERSRFQLFGDTMNTASRMESTGERGKIQVSQDTATLLITAGKSEWLTLRDEKVAPKGKGEMQTYWLEQPESDKTDTVSVTSMSSGNSSDVSTTENTDSDDAAMDLAKVADLSSGKTARLIDWNTDVLVRLLRQIVARRNCLAATKPEAGGEPLLPCGADLELPEDHTVLDEVKEIITLPTFDAQAAKRQEDPETIVLDPAVIDQLRDYVSAVAALYRENPFHNFEHASHVTMSVVKLLARIVAPTETVEETAATKGIAGMASQQHDNTFGITSDPLTQFACVLSALIHDVDHTGVPNNILVKENAKIASFYKNKSVAEQNSVDISWDLLMEDVYVDLRATIFGTDSERSRFRQLIVNSVMATDIMDKDLKQLRNNRWDKAFSEGAPNDNPRDDINRKATIVIEHLIQASDVAHTMQHWHIYRKWNERLFHEMHKAWKNGRGDKNPAEFWYKGEIGFFDFYIIPLAKKLKNCGVFGVSSDEYLNYAMKNRQEWEARGLEIVNEMVENMNKDKGGVPQTIVPVNNNTAAAPKVKKQRKVRSSKIARTESQDKVADFLVTNYRF